MTTKVKLNHNTVQEYLDGDHGVSDLLERRADAILSRARAAAPVRSGDYRNSLHVETAHTDRMVKRVVADVDYAWAVEATHGTLSRALDGAGGS
jgi:hypothetical protein